MRRCARRSCTSALTAARWSWRRQAAGNAYAEGMRNARHQALVGTSTGLAVQVAFLAVPGVGGARVADSSSPRDERIAGDAGLGGSAAHGPPPEVQILTAPSRYLAPLVGG